MDIHTLLANDSTATSRNDITTPMPLVKEMLDAIPIRVFKDGMTILDPCVGLGNFLIGIRDKLTKYNVSGNLVGLDTNAERVNIAQQLLPEATIKTGNFLDMPTELYDIIMANPPYAKITDGKRASKNHNIFPEFILKSLSMLKEGGAIIFICPTSWMSLSDRNIVSQRLTALNMIRLDINSSKKWFPGVGSSFSWFVCVNESHKGMTHVTGKHLKHMFDSNVVLRNERFIPLLCTDMAMCIMKKITSGTAKLGIETSSDLHATTRKDIISNHQDDKHPYKLVHTKLQTKWAQRPHKFQDGIKVFICLSSTYETWIDACGMTQSAAFVRCIDSEQALDVKKTLDSLPFAFAVSITRYGNFANIRVLQRLTIRDDYTDDELDYMKKFTNVF